MTSPSSTLLILSLVVLVLLPSQTYAFGAGEIPDFAYLNDKAFRHGDLENILSELAKTVGGVASGGSIFGIAQSILGAASGGNKFSREDVKKVYFGNWLRDYSQAMDIAGLSKLTSDTLVLIVSILGFLTFGFATDEYQVTADRLGVYLPVEHIDNPKGYAEQEGDARQFHPKLRPPVNPEELEIDLRMGMKNYMATEHRGWDTSTAHIRRTFKACIEYGRRARGNEGADLWEAYRLLGTGLHTMEDLLAHSNWCELALRKMGHENVFCHVGDDVLIDTPNGEAPPLVTGTFGSADFLHSLMGEATDHLSQASVVDLSQNLANATENDSDSGLLRSLLEKLPIGGSDDEEKVSQADDMKEKAKAYQFNPDEIMPPDVQAQLMQLLRWRDDIYRDVLKKIAMVPGLDSLIDALTNALNAFVYTILAPYLTPALQQVTSVLSEGSKAVIDSEDQFEVFNNPNASDPSHSLLSKDHFGLILNEPAGKTALVVVRYSVKLIVDAWFSDNESPDRVIDKILEAFHHPYYNVGRSSIQQEMFEEMERWIRDLDSEDSERTLQALTKESVRAGKNKRQGSDDDTTSSNQAYGQAHAHGQVSQGGYSQGGYDGSADSGENRSGKQQYGSSYARSQQQYGSTDDVYSSSRNDHRTSNTYTANSEPQGYGRSEDTQDYGGRRQQGSVYNEGYGGDDEPSSYNRRRNDDEEQPPARRYVAETYSSESRTDSYESSRYGQESSYVREESCSSRQQEYQPPQTESSTGYAPSYQPAYESNSERYSESRSSRTEGYEGGRGQEGPYRSQRTQGYESEAYRRPEEPSRYERREEESGGYGGHPTRRTEYSQEESRFGGRPSEGGGYGREDGGRPAYDESSHSYGRRQQEEERPRGYGSGGNYGESEGRGYGGGYSGRDETFGAERLNISEEGEEHPHHGKHHKKHHHQSDDY